MVQFEICGLGIEVRGERDVTVRGDSLRFETRMEQPEITVDCRAVPTPALRGERLAAEVWRDGDVIRRCTMKGDIPAAVLSYREGEPARAKLEVREEDWGWVTDHLRLWSTLCLPALLLPARTLIFHAAFVECGGEGILFTAPSGTGKSTQAALWQTHRGARVINGDKAAVSLRGNAVAHGVPVSGTSGICENQSLYLKGIVVLSQAGENTVRRLSPSQAVAALCANLFADDAVGSEWSAALALLLDLVEQVPVYALACTPDLRAVETLERAMKEVAS